MSEVTTMASHISDVFPVVPSSKQDRPRTLKVVPPVRPPAHLGAVRNRPPPPDVMRVLSSIALVGALVLALAIQCLVG